MRGRERGFGTRRGEGLTGAVSMSSEDWGLPREAVMVDLSGPSVRRDAGVTDGVRLETYSLGD